MCARIVPPSIKPAQVLAAKRFRELSLDQLVDYYLQKFQVNQSIEFELSPEESEFWAEFDRKYIRDWSCKCECDGVEVEYHRLYTLKGGKRIVDLGKVVNTYDQNRTECDGVEVVDGFIYLMKGSTRYIKFDELEPRYSLKDIMASTGKMRML